MSTLYKYPRTPHLPFSPGATSDDKYADNKTIDFLQSEIDLVVTEKMDGGNLTFYRDAFHGRSLDSGTHAWDRMAKALWASVCNDIPDNWRISGESLYARRSVSYDNLPSVFLIFGIWNEENEMLSWDEIEEWAELLGIPTVPVLYRGKSYDEATSVWFDKLNPDVSEGFVLRNSGRFSYRDFDKNMVKYVRANHVQTCADWRHRDDFAVNTFI